MLGDRKCWKFGVVCFFNHEKLETTRQAQRRFPGFRYELKFTRCILLHPCWNAFSLYFPFLSLPFDQLEILEKSIYFVFTNVTRKPLKNFWARSNFCVEARGCFRKSFAFFSIFSMGNCITILSMILNSGLLGKLSPTFARWSVYLKQKQEKLTISTLCSKRCKLNMAVFSFLPAWVTILLYMVRFFFHV